MEKLKEWTSGHLVTLIKSNIHGTEYIIAVVTRMDTPKYGETLKFMYIKYQPILVVLPKV